MNTDETPQTEPEPEDKLALERRIQELEDRLAALQDEIEQQEPKPSLRANLRQNLRPLVLLLVIIILALIPSILVVRERWLNLPAWELFNIESWCNNEYLCHTGLPSYFGFIFLFALLVVLVLLVYKTRQDEPDNGRDVGPDAGRDAEPDSVADAEPDSVADAEPDSVADAGLDAVADAEPGAVRDAEPGAVRDAEPVDRMITPVEAESAREALQPAPLPKGRLRLSLGLRWGAAALAAAFSLLALLTGTIHGWGFSLSLLCYLTGWLLVDFDWEGVWTSLRRNWQLYISAAAALLALVLFLRALAWSPPLSWGSLLLAVFAFANLARFYRQLPAIFWVFILALVSFGLYLNRWSFATIGDEYAFFNRALDIATRHNLDQVLANLFNGVDVYGKFTYLSSVLQAFSMKVFGLDSFGWRFSNVLLSAVSVVLLYYFFIRFTRRDVALIAAVLMATSVYLMTFGKIGYNNLDALFSMALTLWSAGWAVRSRRRLAYAVWGLSMGLCLYLYPVALYILPLAVLLVLLFDLPRSRQAFSLWGIAAVGFIIFLLPLLFQPEYWGTKGMGIITYNPEVTASTHSVALHVVSNFINSLVSHLYTTQETHLVPVGYADPLTAAFILVGLGLRFKRIPGERFSLFALASTLFLLVAIGVSHDRRFPPTTRMFLLVPWYAYFAAEALSWLASQVTALRITRWTRGGMIAAALVSMVMLNFYLSYSLSLRRNNANQTMEGLFLGIVQRLPEFEPVRAKPLTFLFLTDGQWNIGGLQTLLQAYSYPASRVHLFEEQIAGSEIPEALKPLIMDRETLVIMQPSMDASWQEGLGAQLVEMGREACEIKEYTQVDTRFTLWHEPGLKALCGFP